jgi:Calsyntenin C-terminal
VLNIAIQSVTINNERTTVTVKGSHLESVEKVMSGVKYMNSRAFPTPGHRPISFETNAVLVSWNVILYALIIVYSKFIGLLSLLTH